MRPMEEGGGLVKKGDIKRATDSMYLVYKHLYIPSITCIDSHINLISIILRSSRSYI